MRRSERGRRLRAEATARASVVFPPPAGPVRKMESPRSHRLCPLGVGTRGHGEPGPRWWEAPRERGRDTGRTTRSGSPTESGRSVRRDFPGLFAVLGWRGRATSRYLRAGPFPFANQGVAQVCGNGHGATHPALPAARAVVHVDPDKGFSPCLGPPHHVEAFDGELGGAAEAEHLMDAPVLPVEEVVGEGASSAIGLAVGAPDRFCERSGTNERLRRTPALPAQRIPNPRPARRPIPRRVFIRP